MYQYLRKAINIYSNSTTVLFICIAVSCTTIQGCIAGTIFEARGQKTVCLRYVVQVYYSVFKSVKYRVTGRTNFLRWLLYSTMPRSDRFSNLCIE